MLMPEIAAESKRNVSSIRYAVLKGELPVAARAGRRGRLLLFDPVVVRRFIAKRWRAAEARREG
jgi:hypothetical protein